MIVGGPPCQAKPGILRASAGAGIGDQRNLEGDSGFARPVSNADLPISGNCQGGSRDRFVFELRRTDAIPARLLSVLLLGPVRSRNCGSDDTELGF